MRRSWFARHRALGVVLTVVLTYGCAGTVRGDGGKPTATGGHAEAADAGHRLRPGVPREDARGRTFLVTRVVDGDTLELANGATVRLLGIDTPERGDCGYEAAGSNLARLVSGRRVRLTRSDEDADRYGRLLRYVDVGAVDAGLRQIRQGFAIARYDSRDGYGFHPREPAYIRADDASKQLSCPRPQLAQPPSTGGKSCMAGYSPCLPVVGDLDCAAIAGPVRVTGADPYRLDADGDGVGCDS